MLGDEPYEGELLPVNSTEDGEGNIYTFQQLRNQQFSWKDNGKKLRCVIIHDMIDEDDIKEVSVPITVRCESILKFKRIDLTVYLWPVFLNQWSYL